MDVTASGTSSSHPTKPTAMNFRFSTSFARICRSKNWSTPTYQHRCSVAYANVNRPSMRRTRTGQARPTRSCAGVGTSESVSSVSVQNPSRSSTASMGFAPSPPVNASQAIFASGRQQAANVAAFRRRKRMRVPARVTTAQ